MTCSHTRTFVRGTLWWFEEPTSIRKLRPATVPIYDHQEVRIEHEQKLVRVCWVLCMKIVWVLSIGVADKASTQETAELLSKSARASQARPEFLASKEALCCFFQESEIHVASFHLQNMICTLRRTERVHSLSQPYCMFLSPVCEISERDAASTIQTLAI